MARSGSQTMTEQLESVNPATGAVIWQGGASDDRDVDNAVECARSAFPAWASLSIGDRITYIEEFGRRLEESRSSLAEAISEEMGKPLWEAKTEVGAMIGKIAVSKRAQEERCKELRQDLPAGVSVTRHRPHGVVAVFGPFNFPGHLPNGHITPALLAGNTIVFKPSELVPRVAEILMDLWSGLPEGVLNLVQGGVSTGRHLAGHAGIDGLFFTGSSTTGRLLSEQFGRTPEKILALEMGGNNPLVVGDISDFDAAAYQIIQSAYLTAGQRCTCARRLILTDTQVLSPLTDWIHRIRVGPYSDDPEPFIGPVVSSKSADQLLAAQERLIESGAKTIVEMKRLQAGTGLLSPGLLDVTDVQNLPDEEHFGPLLKVIRVPDFDAAIAESNKTAYGLSAGILTDNRAEYDRFLQEVRAGIINWNTQTTGASSASPFGGVGISGNHRPSAYYAADYCNYPVASMELEELKKPAKLSPGLDA